MVDRPYLELQLHDGSRLRTFGLHVEEEELVWHRDERDRKIVVMEGHDWQLQMDNEEPVEIVEGYSYSINKMVYHRLIKGSDTLVLRIVEV